MTFFVLLYHKVFTIQTDQVFRVVSTDNVWIPTGHLMIIPAHIPGWKRPLTELAAFHIDRVEICCRFTPECLTSNEPSSPSTPINLSDHRSTPDSTMNSSSEQRSLVPGGSSARKSQLCGLMPKLMP